MVQVICLRTWHPYDGVMHCHRSQSGDTYLNVVHGSQGKCHGSPCTIMDPKEVSWKLRHGTFIPMHNAQVK